VANPIPTKARNTVRIRDEGHCLRCGAAGARELHHRRRRGVGEDPHLVCNLITLCGPNGCHAWAHAHPEDARRLGYIISSYGDEEPFRVPLHSFIGVIVLSCDGGRDWV
jgi:hypothetical protein